MKLELNFYKSVKWYTKEQVEIDDIDSDLIRNYPYYRNMSYTVHIVESDGFLQPYRLFLR